MRRTVSVDAPAKINLTLDVLGLRSDGFHNLDSLVIKVAPVDTITITATPAAATPRLTFSTDDPTLPTDDKNLVVRAANAFFRTTAMLSDIDIRLTKRLPAQAGLGGGSSDAAATLLGLAELFDMPSPQINGIAATVGSDVPLFLTKGVVRMQGRGEVITPEVCQRELFGVIARPDVGVSTPEAYRLLDNLVERVPGNATASMLHLLQSGARLEEIAHSMSNDFEQAIFPHFPEISALSASLLKAGALRTLLCGSGSAVFGLTRSLEDAKRIAQQLSGDVPYIVPTQVWHG